MKKNNYNPKQLPSNPEARQFIAWFPHGWSFIEADNFDTNRPKLKPPKRHRAKSKGRKPSKSQSKTKPNWRTETRYPIEPVIMWNRWKNPAKLIGVSFDSNTRYALADIDRNSPIHPYNDEEAFRQWLNSYEDIGLVASVIIRSSFSEGLHIYFPLPRKINTFNLACALVIRAEQAGIKAKSGELEFFPNTKAYCKYQRIPFKAHRLPLQPHTGSVILNHDLEPIGDSPELFCALMKQAAAKQDMKLLQTASKKARKKIKNRRVGSGNRIKLEKFREDLQKIIAEGWTGSGQTNFLLGQVAKYGQIFTEHKGKDLVNYIAQTAQSMNGYRQYCNHQHEIERRAREYAKSAEHYYWKAGTPRKRTGTYKQHFDKPTNPNHNQEVADTAQSRIAQGLNNLLQAGINLTVTGIVAFRDVLRAEIHKLHGVWVSITTLMKYRQLWHPKDKDIVLGTNVSKPLPEPQSEPIPLPEPLPLSESEPKNSEPKLELKNPEPELKPEPEPKNSKPKSEPKPEIKAVETSQIEQKINQKNTSVEVQKNTNSKTPEPSQNNGCTHLQPKQAKYNQPKASKNKGCTHLAPNEGFCSRHSDRWRLLGEIFRYVGIAKGNLIEYEGIRHLRIATVDPGEIVEVVSTYHGSDLSDPPPARKIVYVRPIERAKQEGWKDERGVAVFLDDLVQFKT